MKRLFNYRTKLLLLTAGIFTLAIAGFLLISCGAGPQTKVTLPNAGAYAINFSPVLQDDFGPDGADAGTDHDPGADGSLDYAKRYYISLANSVSSMVNREFTIEAWVKKIPMIDPSTGAPISLSGSIFTRFGCQTGAGITLGLIGDVPSFQISNDTNSAPDCLTADGGTAAGLVNTGAAVADNIWTHIAGVFVNEIHTHAACTDASGGEAATPHLDLYVNGVYVDCTSSGLGNEKVTNGDFSSPCGTGWTCNNWTILAAKANAPGDTTILTQNTNVGAGEIYQVTYTVSGRTAGSVTVSLGGVSGTARSTNATFTENITTTGTGNLTFTPTAAFDGKLDDVSVKTFGAFTDPFTLGEQIGDYGVDTFNAAVDEVRFWNGARTASQIAQCYYQELGYNGYCTISSDLIGYWKLNEGAGKSIIDYSGGGNTGTKYYCENTDIDAPPIESIGDGIGDDDGICEAGEVCTDPNESDGAYGITVATGQGCSSPPTSTEWTGGWVAGKSF